MKRVLQIFRKIHFIHKPVRTVLYLLPFKIDVLSQFQFRIRAGGKQPLCLGNQLSVTLRYFLPSLKCHQKMFSVSTV